MFISLLQEGDIESYIFDDGEVREI